MASHSRNLRPSKVVWLQDDVTSPRFYWLENRAPQGGQRVVASVAGQAVRIEEATGLASLTVLLDDSMLDLDAPVEVTFAGRTIFEGKVERSIAAIARTLGERRDPAGVFTAEITVDLANSDAAPAKESIPSGS
jgi:hypothetical protein